MLSKKFLPFLIISLSATAFLAGYVLISRGLNNTRSNTGTILDKFNPQQDEQTARSDKTNTEEGGAVLLSERRAISPTNSSSSNSILYYDKDTGNLFELNLDDKTERTVSDKALPDFISAIWSPLKRSAINLFYSAAGIKFKYSDITLGTKVDLGGNTHSVAFSPDGHLIVYFYSDKNDTDGIGKIILSQPDGTYPKKILATRIKDLELSWPVPGKIILKTSSSDMFLLTEEGQLTKIMEQKIGLLERWSPSGKKMLFSSISPDQNGLILSTLWIKNVESNNETPLNLEGEASLCAWSRDDINVFCALPKSSSVDEIYQINTLTGSAELIGEPRMIVKEILLSTVENSLVLINASDEKLYLIKISD